MGRHDFMTRVKRLARSVDRAVKRLAMDPVHYGKDGKRLVRHFLIDGESYPPGVREYTAEEAARFDVWVVPKTDDRPEPAPDDPDAR